MSSNTSIRCGNCGGTHPSTALVRKCYDTADRTNQPAPRAQAQARAPRVETPATAKQVAYLTKLAHERPMWAQVENMHDDVIAKLTKADASAKINEALAVAVEVKAQAPAERTEYQAQAKRGDVHVVDGVYYRIHVAQNSGNAYAARAHIVGEAQWAADGSLIEAADIKWSYERGFIRKLSQETKATPEQAAAFGHLVGRCCFCSHAIDTPESTQAGYGPVCAAKYDLPWG